MGNNHHHIIIAIIFHLLIPWTQCLAPFSHLVTYAYMRYNGVPFPNKTVNFYIEEKGMHATMIRVIRDSQAYIAQKTCVKFKEMQKGNLKHRNGSYKNFVHYVDHSLPKCSADLKTGVYQQVRVAGLWSGQCINAVMHEILHALGFAHEHTRMDRDLYIKVDTSNSHAPGEDTSNYDQNYVYGITPYDYLSVMHYGQDKPQPDGSEVEGVITPKDPNYKYIIGDVANQLSFYDLMGINKEYKCDEHCPSPNPCRSHSYRDKNCNCQCDVFAWNLASRDYLFFHNQMYRLRKLVNDLHGRIFSCLPFEKAFPRAECGIGWKRHKDKCYIKFQDHMTWDEANDKCLFNGGRIVSPKTEDENDYLATEISEDHTWINTKYDVDENTWVWLDTGRPLTRDYTNWFRYFWEPACSDEYPYCHEFSQERCENDVVFSNKRCPYMCSRCPAPIFTMKNYCVAMRKADGKWKNIPCHHSEKIGVMCQKQYGCEEGWTRHEDDCNKFVTPVNENWWKAQQTCRDHDAYLPRSRTPAENKLLANLLKKNFGGIKVDYNFVWINATSGETNWEPYWQKQWIGDEVRKQDDPNMYMLNRDGWWATRSPGIDHVASVICQKPRIVILGGESVTACDRQPTTIRCPQFSKIKIRRVIWGRQDAYTCLTESPKVDPSTVDTNCYTKHMILWATGLVSTKCNGERTCDLKANNDLHGGGDPCPQTEKYLNVQFDCLEAPLFGSSEDLPWCYHMKEDPDNIHGYLKIDYYGNWNKKSCNLSILTSGSTWSQRDCTCVEDINLAKHGSCGNKFGVGVKLLLVAKATLIILFR